MEVRVVIAMEEGLPVCWRRVIRSGRGQVSLHRRGGGHGDRGHGLGGRVAVLVLLVLLLVLLVLLVLLHLLIVLCIAPGERRSAML